MLLLEAATSAGFLAAYCMDYPHRTTAKKFYIMLSKSHTTNKHKETEKQEQEQEETAQQCLARCCNLAWPATASCSLPWLTWREGNNARAARVCASRVMQEHANVGKRSLRLLRHASSYGGALPPPCLSSGQKSINSGEDDGESDVIVDIAVPHKGLMPCGGPLMLQLQIKKDVLTSSFGDEAGEVATVVVDSRKRKEREEGEDGEEDGNKMEVAVKEIEEIKNKNNEGNNKNKKKEGDDRTLSPVAKLVQRLLGCNDAELTEAYNCTPKTNNKPQQKGGKTEGNSIENEEESTTGGSWTEHFRKARQLEKNTTTSSSTDAKKAFFYLEHVTGGDDTVAESSNIAILHATKPPLPEILVLTSESSSGSGGGGDSEGSLENVQRRLVSLCKDRNASVIGVDMVLHSIDNVSCAWLVYVPTLQTTERKAVWQQWSRWQQE